MTMDWAHPTEEMLAALLLGRQCGRQHRGGLSETQLAEWIMTAKDSLWYFQARRWAEQAPSAVAADSKAIFQAGCKLLLRIVDSGYDPEMKTWWNLRTLFDGQDAWAAAMLVLMDLGVMTKRLPNVHEHGGFTTTSAGFGVFAGIVCGPQWERQYQAMSQAMSQAKRLDVRR
jgi:hypothetical protein